MFEGASTTSLVVTPLVCFSVNPEEFSSRVLELEEEKRRAEERARQQLREHSDNQRQKQLVSARWTHALADGPTPEEHQFSGPRW